MDDFVIVDIYPNAEKTRYRISVWDKELRESTTAIYLTPEMAHALARQIQEWIPEPN